MPLQETSGAASYDAFGGGVAVVPQYIEDVFSTYLYAGNGSTQTITNGIDLSTKGGLVWQKDRSQGTGYHHILQDTARGATNCLFTNLTNAQSQDSAGTGFVFNNNGFTIGTSNVKVNASGDNYVSWTFRKQPKFFDIVTYTGDGIAGKTISHNLGSTPAFIIVKGVDVARAWFCYHSSLGPTKYIRLDDTGAATTDSTIWNDTSPTSTQFTVGGSTGTNFSGYQFVAYLFAHNAGGFGLTGTDNVISCGSFTTDADGLNSGVTLGYEPQWMLVKPSSTADNWQIVDNMRGMSVTDTYRLFANTSGATNQVGAALFSPTATGFTCPLSGGLAGSSTYIYIAIRRGPMKVPTDATKVFTPIAATPSATASASIAVTPDMFLFKGRNINDPFWTEDRLRYFALANTSSAKQLQVNSTAAEVTQLPIAYYIQNASMNWGGYLDGTASIIYNFKRAPSVFDEVCYTGDGGSNRALSHNLQVVPELVIYKRRSGIADWLVWTTSQTGKGALLNTTDAFFTNANTAGTSTWTSSTIYIKNAGFDGTSTNGSGSTYVAYLFATCAGVSKVGSYTGTGSTQTISCGFTGGARFVLIRRTDSTGSWWVWDTARGMVSGNDKRLALNSSASEINADWVYTTTGGFQIVTNDAEVNASGGTYIFLAMA